MRFKLDGQKLDNYDKIDICFYILIWLLILKMAYILISGGYN